MDPQARNSRPGIRPHSVAFMDFGTNSVRLLVVRFEPKDAYTVLHRLKKAVRLGEGEFSERQLNAAAMQRAVAMLDPQPDALLIDAVNLQSLIFLPQRFLKFGDSISLSIAAASIIAKVSRDRALSALDARYPGYGFARHKGYGTAAHHAALKRLGVTEIHRKSYAPVRALIPMGV